MSKERILYRDTIIRRLRKEGPSIRFTYHNAFRIFRCLEIAKWAGDNRSNQWNSPALSGLQLTADGDVAVWAAYLSNRMPPTGWVNHKRHEQWRKLLMEKYQRDPDIPF